MTGVRALSGYLDSPRHGLLAFTILVNNYTCTPRRLQEAIRDFLAALSDVVPRASTGAGALADSIKMLTLCP
jgi:D-alanyl-D-alanine carboxypeptidase